MSESGGGGGWLVELLSNFKQGFNNENSFLALSYPSRTISSTKYVDDGSKYGVMSNNNNGHGMEEMKYVTSSCSMDGGVDPSKGYGSIVPNGQQQMTQNGGGGGQSNGGAGNVIMVGNNSNNNNCSGSSGAEEDSLSQQHQVKAEDNSHSYVLPPFLH